MPNDEWRRFYEECLKYECRHCNAKKGNSCRDTNLRKAKPHSARQEAVRLAHWEWNRLKTAECPTCGGKGRVPVVGPQATHVAAGNPSRLLKGGEHLKCQFCEKEYPALEWSGDKCPACGRKYDYLLAQEGDD